MSLKPTVQTVGRLLEAMGPAARAVLKETIDTVLRDGRAPVSAVLDASGIESMPMEDFIALWKGHMGPRYYPMSVLSIERQAEVLALIGRPLEVYRQRKGKMLDARLANWRGYSQEKLQAVLDEAAWASVNTTDSDGGFRLQFGLRNAGCDYWQQSGDSVGCYNCGYFASCMPQEFLAEFSEEDGLGAILVAQFRKVIEEHLEPGNPAFDVIDIVGDGSFLNAKEVPVEAQDEIFRDIAKLPVSRLLVESRPEYIVPERIEAILALLRPDQKLELAVGLETADPFVATYCINKGYLAEPLAIGGITQPDFATVIDRLAPFRERCAVQAYVLVKPAFLNESECIADTVHTVRRLRKLADETGFPITAKLEPTVVCYGSLLEVLNDTWLSRDGEVRVCPEDGEPPQGDERTQWRVVHTPPSYWSVVEILAELAGDESHEICRIGAREDMDVFKAIPGVYEGNVLSPVDPVLYNAVQHFNRQPRGLQGLVNLLAEISTVTDDRSFGRWQAVARRWAPKTAQLIRELDIEIRAAKTEMEEDGYLHRLEAIRQIAPHLQESPVLHEAVLAVKGRWHADDPDLREELSRIVEPAVHEAVGRFLPEMRAEDVRVDQVQYVDEPPESVRFEVNIGTEQDTSRIDLWVLKLINPSDEVDKSRGDEASREIERKWIIDEIPFHLLESPNPLLQAYIAISATEEVRVRRKAAKNPAPGDDPFQYLVTYKSSGGRSRDEFEAKIPKETFETLLLAAGGRVIEKDRYIIDDPERVPELKVEGEKLKIELDLFKGSLLGLATAEVEFSNDEAAKKFKGPAWFGQEVTLDRRFQNQSLATAGLDNAIIRQDARYSQAVIALSPHYTEEQLSAFGEACPWDLKLLRFEDLPLFVGRIQREAAAAIRSCALLITEPFEGVPSMGAFHALRMQTGRTTLSVRRHDGNSSPQLSRQKLTDSLHKAFRSPRYQDTHFFLDSIRTLSAHIQSQSFVDNDQLAAIERVAGTITVITTTLEFDIGALQETVKKNLNSGKTYSYYIPDIGVNPLVFPDLRRNFHKFQKLFWPFQNQIRFAAIPACFVPNFREIIVYEHSTLAHEKGSAPYGFTYVEAMRESEQLELIELPAPIPSQILSWVQANGKAHNAWQLEEETDDKE